MTEIIVATPMYAGQCYGLYMQSMLGLQVALGRNGIAMGFAANFYDALIPRARNTLVNRFLIETEGTHLLLIDADIAFNPNDILKLLDYDKDVIGAPYAKKYIDWENVKLALKDHPDMDEFALRAVIGNLAFVPVEGQSAQDDVIEVVHAGTGCFLIKREVFEQLNPICDQYQLNLPGYPQRTMHDYFGCFVVDNELYSEDYAFCHRWRSTGGKIHLCPYMSLHHIGQYIYEGNLGAISHFTGDVNKGFSN